MIETDTCIECGKPFEPDQFIVHCNGCGKQKENKILRGEPSVDRVREENEIVEICGQLEHYDDDDFTPPSFINELEGEDSNDFWEWVQALLQASARNAIGMLADREGGNEGCTLKE